MLSLVLIPALPCPPLPSHIHTCYLARCCPAAMQTAAFLGPVAALMVLASPTITAGKAVAAMTAALGITSLGQAGFVANMSDIAPKHAGRLFGLCNTFGCLAGILGVSGMWRGLADRSAWNG